MRKINTLIGAALLLLSVLATAAFAAPLRGGAEQTAITGTETRHFGVPDRVWNVGSVTQIRGLALTGTFAFSGEGVTLAGTETVVTNATLFGGGDGFTWGVATYTDAASGVTRPGTVIGQITNVFGTLKLNAPCSDGKLLKGTRIAKPRCLRPLPELDSWAGSRGSAPPGERHPSHAAGTPLPF